MYGIVIIVDESSSFVTATFNELGRCKISLLMFEMSLFFLGEIRSQLDDLYHFPLYSYLYQPQSIIDDESPFFFMIIHPPDDSSTTRFSIPSELF